MKGRKPGFKHSEETKKKIAASMRGKTHSQETKDKIAKALTKEYGFSDDLKAQYKNNKELLKWIEDNAKELDKGTIAMSRITSYSTLFIPYGSSIEDISEGDYRLKK